MASLEKVTQLIHTCWIDYSFLTPSMQNNIYNNGHVVPTYSTFLAPVVFQFSALPVFVN